MEDISGRKCDGLGRTAEQHSVGEPQFVFPVAIQVGEPGMSRTTHRDGGPACAARAIAIAHEALAEEHRSKGIGRRTRQHEAQSLSALASGEIEGVGHEGFFGGPAVPIALPRSVARCGIGRPARPRSVGQWTKRVENHGVVVPGGAREVVFQQQGPLLEQPAAELRHDRSGPTGDDGYGKTTLVRAPQSSPAAA